MTPHSKTFTLPVLATTALLLALHSPSHAANLVKNGSFETNGGVGEMVPSISSAANWNVGTTPDGSPFDFIVDSNADSTGFPSVFSPPNIMIWGPNTPFGLSDPTHSFPSQHQVNPVSNGFTGSPDGGFFFGADAAYANAPISQQIDNLVVGHEYTLSFYYAGAQFTDALGPNTEGWQVSFGTDTVTTPILSNASQGFTGWQTYTNTFTATATSQLLSFFAQGGPTGLPPFALLDGVSLTDNTNPPSSTPEPTTVGLVVCGILGAVGARRLRKNRA